MALPNSFPDSEMTPEPTALKRWTTQDYHRMGELGIFDPNEGTELIAGQIMLMAPKGTAHVTSSHLLANALRDCALRTGIANRLGNTAFVRTQDPIQLDRFSEPEPN